MWISIKNLIFSQDSTKTNNLAVNVIDRYTRETISQDEILFKERTYGMCQTLKQTNFPLTLPTRAAKKFAPA